VSHTPYDNRQYHSSITDELHILKDRIRNLVRYWDEEVEDGQEEEESQEENEGRRGSRSNWQTDGEWKESAIRTILRRHLPSHLFVGRGFILFKKDSSTQIDILILGGAKPIVFRDGDLAIVTPDAADVLVEVKTRFRKPWEAKEAIRKLCKIGRQCAETVGRSPWLGLFVYDVYDGDVTSDTLLDAVAEAHQESGVPVNCISYGRDTFFRFWLPGEWEKGDPPEVRTKARFRSYRLPEVAPAYFIGNVIDRTCSIDNQHSDFAWFTYHQGKGDLKTGEQVVPPKPVGKDIWLGARRRE
jgi:hypothetical protein